MKGIYFLLTIMLMAVFGCNEYRKRMGADGGDSIAVEVQTGIAPRTDFYGTYTGTLPCADCSGVRTTLTIHDDTTYDLRSEYLGKENGVFEENGIYRVVGVDVIELITPSTSDRTYYKILNGSIVLSDSTGMISRDELADYYVLKKQ